MQDETLGGVLGPRPANPGPYPFHWRDPAPDGQEHAPAPLLSEAEQATVDRFDQGPDALELMRDRRVDTIAATLRRAGLAAPDAVALLVTADLERAGYVLLRDASDELLDAAISRGRRDGTLHTVEVNGELRRG